MLKTSPKGVYYYIIPQHITNKMHFDVKKVFRAESSAESFDFTAVFLYFFPKCLAISKNCCTFAAQSWGLLLQGRPSLT